MHRCQIGGKSGVLHTHFDRNRPLLSFAHLGQHTNAVPGQIPDGIVQEDRRKNQQPRIEKVFAVEGDNTATIQAKAITETPGMVLQNS